MNTNTPVKSLDSRALTLCLGLLVVCGLGISTQSLWIDESYTALKAQASSLPGWWHVMRSKTGSDLQMPLYMLWIWACARLVGTSEVALRAVNLSWIVPGLVILWRVLAGEPPRQRAVFLAAVCSPFLAYYLVEARPYAMQIGASLVLAATLWRWSEKPVAPHSGDPLWVWGFVAALVVLSGASMLGMIWAGTAILAALFLSPKERLLKLGRNYLPAWLTGIVLLAALGVYYLWTLKAGARASNLATTDWKNVAFIGYELLGFAGLGPGRLEIREGGLRVFQPYAPELILFAMLVLGLICLAIDDWLRKGPRKKLLGLALIVAAPAIFILAAGVVLHFRVLGRHFAPLLAVLVLMLGQGIHVVWRRGGAGKLLVVGFLAMCLVSTLALHLAPRHAKDDYRSAASLARTALAAGQTVWWSADAAAPMYYHLAVIKNAGIASRAVLVVNPRADFLATNTPADVVILSRPDIYDPHGILAGFVARNHYHRAAVLPAFVIWEKPAR